MQWRIMGGSGLVAAIETQHPALICYVSILANGFDRDVFRDDTIKLTQRVISQE